MLILCNPYSSRVGPLARMPEVAEGQQHDIDIERNERDHTIRPS
jgi:hypothetical protein